jgi:hypothetical protein
MVFSCYRRQECARKGVRKKLFSIPLRTVGNALKGVKAASIGEMGLFYQASQSAGGPVFVKINVDTIP